MLHYLIFIVLLNYTSLLYANSNMDIANFKQPGDADIQLANELLNTVKRQDTFLEEAIDLTKHSQAPMSCRFDVPGMPCKSYTDNTLATSKQKISTLGNQNRINKSFYIFVSFSLPEHALIHLGKQAKRYGGTLVFRGFKDGNFKVMVAALRKFIDKTKSGIIIEPTLFSQYNITAVPTFILANNKQHDKLQGNVSLKFALEKMVETGDLKQLALILLNSEANNAKP